MPGGFQRARLVGHRDGGGRLDAAKRVGKETHGLRGSGGWKNARTLVRCTTNLKGVNTYVNSLEMGIVPILAGDQSEGNATCRLFRPMPTISPSPPPTSSGSYRRASSSARRTSSQRRRRCPSRTTISSITALSSCPQACRSAGSQSFSRTPPSGRPSPTQDRLDRGPRRDQSRRRGERPCHQRRLDRRLRRDRHRLMRGRRDRARQLRLHPRQDRRDQGNPARRLHPDQQRDHRVGWRCHRCFS